MVKEGTNDLKVIGYLVDEGLIIYRLSSLWNGVEFLISREVLLLITKEGLEWQDFGRIPGPHVYLTSVADIMPHIVHNSPEQGNFVPKWKDVIPKNLKAIGLAYIYFVQSFSLQYSFDISAPSSLLYVSKKICKFRAFYYRCLTLLVIWTNLLHREQFWLMMRLERVGTDGGLVVDVWGMDGQGMCGPDSSLIKTCWFI